MSRGRQNEVQASPGLSIRVDVDEDAHLSYSYEAEAESEAEASDLRSAAETDIQSAIRLALRPQRRIAADAIEVLWTREG